MRILKAINCWLWKSRTIIMLYLYSHFNLLYHSIHFHRLKSIADLGNLLSNQSFKPTWQKMHESEFVWNLSLINDQSMVPTKFKRFRYTIKERYIELSRSKAIRQPKINIKWTVKKWPFKKLHERMLKEWNQRIENPISGQLPSVRIRITLNSTNWSASIKKTIIIIIITTSIYIMKGGK